MNPCMFALKECIKHLWRKIMLVKDEALAKELVEDRNQDKEIRRVVGIDHIKSSAHKHIEGDQESRHQRIAVFKEIAHSTFCHKEHRIAVDVNALHDLMGRLGDE